MAGNCEGQSHESMKATPATVLVLQEAHVKAGLVLEEPEYAPQSSSRRDGPSARPSACFWVCRAPEECNTLLVAARRSLCEQVELLDWVLHRDGEFKDRGRQPRVALSRMLTCRIQWKSPMHGQDDLIVCNVHYHHHHGEPVQG